MTIEDINNFLRSAPQNYTSRNSEPPRQYLTNQKNEAVIANDQNGAKSIWCLKQIIEIQDKFIEAFFQLKQDKFYEAWCSYERIEIELHFLSRHFQDINDEFYIPFISRHTARYQSIFPYTLFMSPEFLEEEKKCTICKQIVSIRNPCGHRVGEIYNGEMCGREVTKVQILGMAFVRNPVQRYSVPFLSGENGDNRKDQYNYSLVKYLIQRLESPFHEWEVERTKRRHPHSRFSHIGRNDPCPCESGIKYKRCCLLESGVLRPHCLFTFQIKPPAHLLTIEYSD